MLHLHTLAIWRLPMRQAVARVDHSATFCARLGRDLIFWSTVHVASRRCGIFCAQIKLANAHCQAAWGELRVRREQKRLN